MISQDQINPIGHYWENIPPESTQKHRNKVQFKHIVYQKSKEKQLGTSPVESPVTERNFLWLGGTTTNSMTPKIILSQYARTVSKSNTKGYRIVPYFGWLK